MKDTNLSTSENSELLTMNKRNRLSFSNIGITFSGESLKDLAKERGAVNTDKKYPVYEYPFEFVGFKYSMMEKDDKQMESVIFLSPEGRQFSTFGSVILDEVKAFEKSEYVSRDEAGSIKMENGFFMTTEKIEPVFTYYEGRGDFGGYAKLN